jgi:hypothetical protein
MDTPSGATRGRGRGGFEAGRGGRGGRGGFADRGRGGAARGGRGGATPAPALNFGGAPSVTSVPTVESTAWDTPAADSSSWDTPATTSWGETTSAPQTIGSGHDVFGGGAVKDPAQEFLKSSIIPQNTTKSWASMLATPKVAPIAPKAAPVPEVQPTSAIPDDTVPESLPEQEHATNFGLEQDREADESIGHQTENPQEIFEHADDTTGLDTTANDELNLAPSHDKLTEEALEQVPDVSQPAPTETAASTRDASSMLGGSTPFASSQQVPTLGNSARPPMGGFATSAWKATGTPGRTTSFHRMMEQREAVVMPGNHAVDRAAVQFGSMGLNGEAGSPDVDDEREESETRTQLPQEPIQAQPKASLPPAPQQQQSQPPIEQHTQDAMPTPKPAPGLDMPSHLTGQQGAGHGPGSIGQPPASQAYGQYGRYGGYGGQEHISSTQQKPYDNFSQQLNYSQSHDTPSAYGAQSQTLGPTTQQGQAQHTGFGGQGQNDYSAQYGNESARGAYGGYGGYGASAGAPGSGAQQESAAPAHRATSGYGAGENAYGAGSQLNQSQSRFADSHPSGSNTPVPSTAAQHQTGPQSQQNQGQQSQGQTGHGGGGYQGYNNNPYYGGSYYGTYMNQASPEMHRVQHSTLTIYQYPNYNYNQHSYGQPYGNNKYNQGQNQGYGMSPQTSYEQSTPSNTASNLGHTSSFQGRDASFVSSGGFGGSDYGRSTSTAPTQSQQGGAAGAASGYGGFPGEQDSSYGGRGASGGPVSNTGMGQYGSGAQGASDASNLKPYHDSKVGSSPSMHQPGRAGSAVNNAGYGGVGGAGSGGQSGYQAPQSQQGFGGYGPGSHTGSGYGGHSNNQYGGLGGLGGHQASAQSHQQGQQGGGYGGYGSGGGFGGNNQYGNSSYNRGGGWGQNYGGGH